MIDIVKKVIESTPRLSLGVWPTPFLPLNRLRSSLGSECPKLWIKREDMTSLGAGGNKIRKLEFVLAKAVNEGADVILNTGEVQSNQTVQTAASSARLGIPCELFLGRKDPPLSEDDQETGNIFLCRLLGAKVHLVPPHESRADAMEKRADELRAEGHHPFVIPRGSSTAESSLGSIECFFELVEQAQAQGFTPNAVCVTAGSSGTAAGFLVGAQVIKKSGGPEIKILAFDALGDDSPVLAHDRIMEHAEEAWKFIGLPGTCGEDCLEVFYKYVGPGYSRPYPAMIDSVKLVAQQEGILIDPNYTGKSMTGMLDLIRSGKFSADDNVVYAHTGGMPALFAMRRNF